MSTSTAAAAANTEAAAATAAAVPNSANPRKIEFYDLDASALTEPGRKLLREYAGVPDDEINDHVEAIVSNKHPHSLILSLTNS